MGKLKVLKDKAAHVVSENREKVDEGLHKAAEFADRKTGHKHTDKIDSAEHSVAGKLDEVTGSEIGADEPATPKPSIPSVSASAPQAADSAVDPGVVWNSNPEATAEPTRTTPHQRTQ